MFLVLLMIFDPEGGWGRAVESARSTRRVLWLHLFPLLLIGCVAEGYGMMRWGKRAGPFGTLRNFNLPEVVAYELCQFTIGLGVVLLGAFVLRRLSNTFHARQKFTPALAVCSFGLGPIFLMRMCDAFPTVFPWVPWLIGAGLTMGILYQGIPRLMNLDPAHALGVYMSSMLVMVLASGIGRLLVIHFLQQRVLGLHSIV